MEKLYHEKIAVTTKHQNSPYYTPDEGLQRVKRGGFAFHVEIATAYKIIEVYYRILLLDKIIFIKKKN